MDQADIPALLSRLASDEDAARKMAVFKLQSSINDPAFADVFISAGGLIILRRLIMTAGGNTLAYSLQSLTRVLEVDMGWEIFEGPTAGDLVERIVELVVTNPLVNILRGAMSILVALVSHSQSAPAPTSPTTSTAGTLGAAKAPGSFGFRALKPAVAVYPQFFGLVIQQLHSADHSLCANALMLINALIRDAVSNEGGQQRDGASGAGKSASSGEDWPKFIKKLQDLGLIKAVFNLMQSSALQDLAHPLLEFQSLTKLLLRKWKEVKVDVEKPEHRRALKGLHLSSAPSRDLKDLGSTNPIARIEELLENGKKGSRKHNPEKWRRLGFETESPAMEFEETGFLGMMDLTDYVRRNEDNFQKMLLEQSTKPLHERCPIARASLAVTLTLYEHFDCDKSDWEDVRGYQLTDADHQDKLFRPLILQWSRIHTAGLHAFFRLWKATGAEQSDFDKVAELMRILVEQVIGQAGRTKDVMEVEEELFEYECSRLRELQMELLELSFENQWGQHLYQVRDVLKQEALTFIKEQRVRCLLQGSWFQKPAPRKESRAAADAAANGGGPGGVGNRRAANGTLWRYVKLSHNRRYLHWADFALRTAQEPSLDSLAEKIDLRTISSVVSNVSTTSNDDAKSGVSDPTLKMQPNGNGLGGAAGGTKHLAKITIFSFVESDSNGHLSDHDDSEHPKEQPLLTLHPINHSLASEWLDGLLMLLDQSPITSETNKMTKLVEDYGMKIRLLNVRMEAAYAGPPPGAGEVPSREGLDDDYWYDI
ncbi:ELMO/CED-12 family protein [Microdochium trichocladiopsis]|uniref:ELMO/CED-12 family protein n=1 Tax=Microdochium trichocladiopsis TaxID=1682393 RepID=A0A9P8YBQ8_9PEZI|nr:ELMO/CED-12 family protein [Microdochium trichocladiopsis]KAH7035347.1 ELMO/CED-12 family protein [Microdochium trichocladiopsis]